MTTVRKLERDRARADIAAVVGLIGRLGDEDVMARFGLEARLAELRTTVADLDLSGLEAAASATLFFGGRPVFGSKGIESEFGSAAISKFQDLVAKVLAQEYAGLGERGVVAKKPASKLHITNIVRGSFGFHLEEMQPQLEMVDTALKTAVEKTAKLLNAFAAPDDERFHATIVECDPRVLSTASDFFDLLRQGGATLRLVAGVRDSRFGTEAVERAADRASTTQMEDVQESISGRLRGVFPDAHKFEFHAQGEVSPIHGKVDRSLSSDQLAAYNRTLLDLEAIADMQVRRISRSGKVAKKRFVLTGIVAARGA